MDENDILYVTTNGARNADHRTMTGPQRSYGPQPPRHIVIQTGAGSQPVIRTIPVDPVPMQTLPERRFFGTLTASEAVEAVAQVIAMLQPLPVAPVAIGKAEDDIANLTLYSAALAQHAKRDEQLRTIGSLLSKLLS